MMVPVPVSLTMVIEESETAEIVTVKVSSVLAFGPAQTGNLMNAVGERPATKVTVPLSLPPNAPPPWACSSRSRFRA